MPYIKVDINKLSQYLQTVENVRAATSSATDDFCAISGSVDAGLRQMNGIDGQLRLIEEELYRHQRVMRNMTAFLDSAQQKYRLLSTFDNVGNANLNTGAAYASPNVAAVLYTQGAAIGSSVSSANVNTNIQNQTSQIRQSATADPGSATVVSSAVNAISLGNIQKESSVDQHTPGNFTATSVPAANSTELTAAVVTGIAGSAAVLEQMDQSQILNLVSSRTNVAVEDLLQGMESGAYCLKDIVECLEGKATDANKFIQNATSFLKGLTGTEDIRFEQANGYWILSGYQRDSTANELVKKYNDGTGIGSRYNETTLKNTPVLGTIFKADQLADTAEKATKVVQKAAEIVDKGTNVVLNIVDTANKIRDRNAVAAVRIEEVWEDDSLSTDHKIAATTAISATNSVSISLDVAGPPAGQAVSSVLGALVETKSGDATLGKEVGNLTGKALTSGIQLVSNVISSDAVVDRVTQSNLEIGKAVVSGCQAIGAANQKLLESDSVGEAIQNVGGLVAEVGKAQKNVLLTVVTETASTACTVGKETVLSAADMVGDAIQSGFQSVSQAVKSEYETLKDFKEDIVGGVGTVAVLAGETCSVLHSSDKDISLAEAITLAANELGISKQDIQDSVNKGFCTTNDIFEYLNGKATDSNAFIKRARTILRTVSGATDMVFENKNGYVIVSEFTRKGWANTLVKKLNDGTGIGTRYKPETLKDTPVIGTLYKVDNVAKTMEKVAMGVDAAVSGVSDIVDAGQKLTNIWSDETLTTKEKVYDSAAVAVTSAVGTALDVAAPFAGAAVKTAVTGALSAVLPGAGTVVGNAVGAVAGAIVENGMELVSDVITSEKVVNQVSDSMTKVGDTVASGVKAVSDAGKKLLESKNTKEALSNTAQFVGAAVQSGTKVVATVVTENAKVALTVAQETAKAVGEAVVSKAKAVCETVKKVAGTAAEAAKKVGAAICAGTTVVSYAAKEAAKKAAAAAEAAKEAAKRKAEQLAREAAEKARKAAQKAAEEVARKAAEAKRKAEEAARKAAEEAKKKAEEIARKAAEAKRKAEEAARRAAEEARKRAEEIARRAAEAKRKAEEAARKAAEEVKRKAAEAKRKAEEAARRAAEEARRRAEEAKRKAAEAARRAAEEARRRAEEAKRKAAEAARRAAEEARRRAEEAKRKAAAAVNKVKKAFSKW